MIESKFGIDDVSLVLYDHNDKVVEGEIYFKNHKEFAVFTKVLMRNCMRFEIVSATLRDRELDRINVLSKD